MAGAELSSFLPVQGLAGLGTWEAAFALVASKIGLDLPASLIEFPLYRVGDRRKLVNEYYLVIKTSDEGLEHCQFCGGPALEHTKCALCGNYPTTGKDELEDN